MRTEKERLIDALRLESAPSLEQAVLQNSRSILDEVALLTISLGPVLEYRPHLGVDEATKVQGEAQTLAQEEAELREGQAIVNEVALEEEGEGTEGEATRLKATLSEELAQRD